MRPELRQYELIDSYIAGKLSPEDKATFENQLAIDPELKDQLEFQTMATQSISRAALREEINAVAATVGAGGAGGAGLGLKWWLGGFFAVGLITTLIFVFMPSDEDPIRNNNEPIAQNTDSKQDSKNQKNTKSNPVVSDNQDTTATVLGGSTPTRFGSSYTPTLIDTVDTGSTPPPAEDTVTEPRVTPKQTFTPWVNFNVQSTSLTAENGGHIVGKQGTLVIIPENAFLDEYDGFITGEVSVELIEALNWEDMFAYNLATMSDGKHLKSGGMINIKAFHDGKEVKLNPNRPLYIEIPTDNYESDMMVWEGEETENGVNWKNPKKQSRFLTQINLADLDFLPSGFVDYLELQMPYKGRTEVTPDFADSIYYALTEWYSPSLHNQFTGVETGHQKRSFRKERRTVNTSPFYFGVGTKAKLKKNPLKNFEATCMIDPSSIRAIKTERFQRSYIATKEFEQRLQAMHKMVYGQAYLDVYLKNTNKDLREADSLCMVLARRAENSDDDIFRNFYNQNATNIEHTIYSTELTNYYQNERKKALERYNRKKSTIASIEKSQKQLTSDFRNGIDPTPLNAATSSTYSFKWAGSSWINIDSYLHLLEEGSKVVKIKTNNDDFGGMIYQSIGYLKTVITLNYEDGLAIAMFPSVETAGSETMRKSYCIGINKLDDGKIQFAWKHYNPYNIKEITLDWDTISQSQLLSRLKAISPYANKIEQEYSKKQRMLKKHKEELVYQMKNAKKLEKRRYRKRRDQYVLWKLMTFVDNCLESDAVTNEDGPLEMPIKVDATVPT